MTLSRHSLHSTTAELFEYSREALISLVGRRHDKFSTSAILSADSTLVVLVLEVAVNGSYVLRLKLRWVTKRLPLKLNMREWFVSGWTELLRFGRGIAVFFKVNTICLANATLIPFKKFSSPRKLISIRRIIAPYRHQKLNDLEATETRIKQTLTEVAK